MAGVGSNNRQQCLPGTGTSGRAAQFCAGQSSAIDQVTLRGRSTPLFKSLPSVRETDTGQVTGASAVTFHDGHPVALMGNVQSDAIGQAPLNGGTSGSFGGLSEAFRFKPTDRLLFRAGVNISSYAATHPQSAATLGGVPGDTLYASNPSDLVPYQNGYAVVDTAANDVLTVTAGFKVSIAARLTTTNETAPAGALGPGSPLQTIAAQAAPSSVAVGPDGALYVGVLGGFPGLENSAVVYRIVPGEAPVAIVTGLTRVTDLAFTPAGKLLILENNTGGALAPPSTPGALLSATPNGSSPVTATNLGVTGLVDPIGLAVDSSGNAFITNDAAGAHQGEIIKVSGLG